MKYIAAYRYGKMNNWPKTCPLFPGLLLGPQLAELMEVIVLISLSVMSNPGKPPILRNKAAGYEQC